MPLLPSTAAENRGPAMLATLYSSTILASLLVASRLFSRRIKLGRWFADDYIILVSLALVYSLVGTITGAISIGQGRHAATLHLLDLELAMLLTMIGLGMGVLSFTLAKAAVVILLIKVLHPPPWQARLLWGLITGNTIFMVAASAVYFLQCSPPQALWMVEVEKKCWDPLVVNSIAISGSGFSALSDFYLALYPAINLWSMEINNRKKIALSVALGFGVCAGTVAIYKCTTVPELLDKSDFTYTTSGVVIWTIIEANSVIIAACIPMIMPLIERWFGRSLLSSRATPTSTSSAFRFGTTVGKDNQTPRYYNDRGESSVESR